MEDDDNVPQEALELDASDFGVSMAINKHLNGRFSESYFEENRFIFEGFSKLRDIENNFKSKVKSSVMEFDNSGCCLETVDESTSLDDNTTVSFSYYFPIMK